jgi:hypothetical protein
MSTPETATRAEYCKMLGIKPKQFAHLVYTRRVALTPDGQHVLVAESKERTSRIAEDREAFLTYPLPKVVNRAELAEFLEIKTVSYTYELEHQGKLVGAGKPNYFLCAESRDRYLASKDLSKAGVAARHAVDRAAKLIAEVATGHAEKTQNQPLAPAEYVQAATGNIAGEGTQPPAGQGYDYQGSKAKREHFAAMEAEASYREKIRELLPASEVRSVMAEVITVLRTSIEGIAFNLAPQLAATSDEVQVKTLLHTEIEHALDTASRNLSKLGRAEG